MFTAGVHGLLSNLINHPSTTKKQHFCHQLILATKCDEPRKVWDFARYWAMKMVGWHHWFDAHEFEQAPGVSDGQGALVCCSWWGRKETRTSDWTELLPSHRFTDAGGRCYILGSETEDFIFTAQPTPWVSAFCDWGICTEQAVSHGGPWG